MGPGAIEHRPLIQWFPLKEFDPLKFLSEGYVPCTCVYVGLNLSEGCQVLRLMYPFFFSYVGLRLRGAQELQEFLRAGEDELVWMREAEALLSNEDFGRDLQGVRFLLKKHQVYGEEREGRGLERVF